MRAKKARKPVNSNAMPDADILNQAKALREQTDHELIECVERLKSMLSTNPKNGDVWLELAKTQWHLRDLNECSASLKQGRSYIPDHAGIWEFSSTINFRQGFFKQAILDLSKAARIRESDLDLWQRLIALSEVHGTPQVTLSYIENALKYCPDHNAFIIKKGRVLLNQNKIVQFDTMIEELDETSPESVALRYLNAEIAFKNGHYFAVQKAISELLMIDPINPCYYEILARVECADENWETAAGITGQGLEFAPNDSELLHLHAVSMTHLNRENDAHKAWSILIQNALIPAQVQSQALVFFARAEGKKGAYAEAELLWERAARKSPQNADAFIGWAKCLKRQGKTGLAIKALQKAISANPKVSELYVLWGSIHLMRRETAKAENVLNKLKGKCGEKDSAFLILSGKIKAKKGDKMAAMQFAVQAITQAPDSDLIARYYAEIAIEFDAYKLAEGLVYRLRDTNPNDIDLLALQTKLFEKSKDFENAEKSYEMLVREKHGGYIYLLDYVNFLHALNRHEEALSLLEGVIAENPHNIDALIALGRSAMKHSFLEKAEAAYENALTIDAFAGAALIGMARIKIRKGEKEEGLTLINKALLSRPNAADILRLRARIHAQLGHYDEALEDAQKAHDIKQGNTQDIGLLTMLQDYAEQAQRTLIIAAPIADMTFVASLSHTSKIEVQNPLSATPFDHVSDWVEQAEASGAEWIACLTDEPDAAVIAWLESQTHIAQRYGRIKIPQGTFYNVEALKDISPDQSWEEMEGLVEQSYLSTLHYHDKHAAFDVTQMAPANHKPDKQGDTVYLISNHGINLFGGGEHFLRGMADIWASFGYEPVIVGMNKGKFGIREGDIDGLKWIGIPPGQDSLREQILNTQPSFIHVLSGLGFDAIEAVKHTECKIIYGTHFWRDMFIGEGSFLDIDLQREPREEFANILRYTDGIYANSQFTAHFPREDFQFHAPVMYSLPADVTLPEQPKPPQNAPVILLNATAQKGFDLLCEIAKRMPDITFMAFASQSDLAQTRAEVAALGLSNLIIQDKTDDTASFYKSARVTLVPSYSFIETFSRVVIEAQRYGCPVIGSDRGNVPLLLTESGVSLAEDADLWVDEIRKLYEDDEYWTERSKAALENSARYNFAAQSDRLSGLIRAAKRKVLVAVGAGIGNLVQTSAAIARLSDQLGQPVDILVKEDWPGCAELFAGHPSVNMIWLTSEDNPNNILATRHYDLAIFLACYGQTAMVVSADVLIHAGQVFPFQESAKIVEPIYYLESLKQSINLPYKKKKDGALFLGGRQPKTQTGGTKIGIHGGSKGGVWAAKKWPYFGELVAMLQKDGFEIHSFGGPDEYIEGTVDKTAMALDQTLDEMADCDYFIANDSGLMHIADALQIPLVAIFGPTSVVKNGPVSKSSSVVQLNKACAPCQFDMDRLAQCKCIEEIEINEVYKSFQNLKEI